LVEIPQEDGTKVARIIMRDCTGKYAWDCRVSYNFPGVALEAPYSLFKPAIELPEQKNEIQKYVSARPKGSIPKYAEYGPPVEQIDELLDYLSETYEDVLPENSKTLNAPAPARPEVNQDTVECEVALLDQVEEDSSAIRKMIRRRPDPESWNFIPPDPSSPQSKAHYCRLFLSHLGFLSYDKHGSFTMVEHSQRFFRSVNLLDKTCGREMLKIGVIHVREGQDDQKDIFRNEKKTELYAEFVSGLGWTIDIANHRGYLGGLDPKLTTGITCPYYANSIMEVIFHEVTSMPTNETDPQQIHKKRHVGNDIVHVVYSEHCSDYDPTTITSQFNDAHIIVYPLPNGLFRVQVYRKDNVQIFGPLLHGMCVNKKLLPILVRQTAINANRYVRYNSDVYTRPFPTRKRALDEIVDRFKVEKTYEDIVSELIIPTQPPPVRSVGQ